MFQAYSNNTTTYTQNTPVAFSTIKYSDCRIKDTNGTTFRISAPGRYLIMFNGVGASTGATSTFTVQLYQEGVARPETLSTITSVAANNAATMGFSTIINILPSCCSINNTTNLQVMVTSATSGTLTNPNLVIMRIR